MAEKKHVIEYIDIIKSFEKVKEKLKNKSDKGHQHGNADITDIDASKIKSGTIDIDRLPKGAIERMVYVKDDAARFALTANTAQNGDTVKVTSTKKMFYVIDDTKLSSEAGYEPYTAESASAVPWSGVTGKPTTFTPEAHTHAISEVADLQETLTGLRQDVNAKPSKDTNTTYSLIQDSTDGHKLTFKGSDGSMKTVTIPDNDHNTWRDVVDSLDSTRTDASLSANQGRVLNEKFASYLPLHGTADIAASVVDYGNTERHIQIGFQGNGITGDDIKYIAGYTSGDGGNLSAKIKDISKDALKSWLGLGSRAYDSTDYLPLSGGTITGKIVKNTSGSWIGDRDRAVVYSMYPGDDGYGCVACMPTKNGSWSMGNLGGVENLIFNYVPDANYSANKNESIHVYLRPTEGTIALTKDIPTTLPASDVYAWAKASSKPSYSWSEITNKPAFGTAATANKGDFATAGHSHGLTHQDLIGSIDTTSGGWDLIGGNNGFILKSIRTNGSAPNWTIDNFSAAIAFGGADTKGIITIPYSYPGVKFAGGNGDSPRWYFDISGTNQKSYNLDSFLTSKPSYSWGEISGRPTALSSFTNDKGYITGITKAMVTGALGYTPPTSDTNTTYSASTGLNLSGTSFSVKYGSTAGTACQGNDSRLSNARPASDVYSWAKANSKPSYTASEVGAAAVYDVKEVIPMNSGTSHEIQTDYSSAIIRIGNLCMAMCGITGTIYPRTWYPVAQIPTPNNSKTYFPTKQTNTIICGISGSDHMEAIIDTKGIIKVWWSGSSPVTSANFCIPYYIK